MSDADAQLQEAAGRLYVVQVNKWGDCVILNARGGCVRGKDGRSRWFTRAEAEQVKRDLTNGREGE